MSDFHYSATNNLFQMKLAKNYVGRLVSLIEKYAPSHGKILDIGAGIGLYACILQKKGHDLLCMEIDDDQRAIIEQCGLPTVADMDAVPDGSIGYAYSLNVLEHIEDDVSALAEWTKKMAPGSKIFFYLPACMSLYSTFDRRVEHFRRYTKQSLKNALIGAGLRIEKIEYADSLGYFAALLFKWIDKGGKGEFKDSSLIFFDRIIFPLSLLLDKICHRFFGKNIYAVVVID